MGRLTWGPVGSRASGAENNELQIASIDDGDAVLTSSVKAIEPGNCDSIEMARDGFLEVAKRPDRCFHREQGNCKDVNSNSETLDPRP